MALVEANLRHEDAVRVRNADRWLRKGRPARALSQLQRLPDQAWAHPWTQQIIWRAANAISIGKLRTSENH